ncbi:MAG TPA: serine hydrolase domain-containing protein [Vicinamibacterales bacterium]|nr:serine hydrolase domain-containing protein [Vicinamibacterales bacterium]
MLVSVAVLFQRPPVVDAATSFGQPAATELSGFVRDAVSRGSVPGAVVAVVNRDGVMYHEAFGMMNAAGNVAMAKGAIFNIASMTKPVTSLATMMLVEEGRLKLDDEVAKYLPTYANPLVLTSVNESDGSYQTRPAKRAITIRHLLTHTSGIGYTFASPKLTAILAKSMKNELDTPLLLLFDPGESWAYGASTRVLGQVVEAISGQRIDAFLESRILRPLGMRDTSYAVPADKYSRVVTTFSRTNGTLVERPVPASLPANVAGDGGLYSTAADYGLFIRMLLNEGRVGTTRIVGARTVRTMFQNNIGSVVIQPQPTANPGLSKPFPLGAGEDKWGLGFQLATPKVKKPNSRSAGSGTWAGIFNTHFWIDPSKEIGVVVMMQLLPFYDDEAMKVLAGVEERVYKNLK